MEDAQPEVSLKTETPPTKSKLKVYIIFGVIALIIVIASVAGYMIENNMAEEKAAAEAEAKKPLPELYYSITPPFIINFQTLGRIRYMQIGVDIMTRDPKVIDAIKDNLPLIKNNLLALFDAQDFDVMTTAQGRQALREAALEEVQKIIQEKTGKSGVEAVLFTSFIIQ